MFKVAVGVLTICLAVALTEGSSWTRGPSRPGGRHGQPIDCTAGPETGPCRASFEMFFYNVTSGACEVFIYGGCRGNGNRFRSRHTCERLCQRTTIISSPDPETFPVSDHHGDTEPDCTAGPETGPCRARFQMYFYNVTSGACEVFFYGGCRGNSNRFRSRQTCETSCPRTAITSSPDPETFPVSDRHGDTEPDCTAGPETGPCRARFEMFFYNVTSGACEVFIYGGCRGNSNRFRSRQTCVTSCPRTAIISSPDPETFPVSDRHGHTEPDCTAKPQSGPCFAMFRMFFYNVTSGACEVFTYGGCRGNGNRFQTRQTCERSCPRTTIISSVDPEDFPVPDPRGDTEPESPEVDPEYEEESQTRPCQPRTCRRNCQYGFQTDDNGCETCRCRRSEQGTGSEDGTTICPQISCRRHCEYGFHTNQHGCQICHCLRQPREEAVEFEVTPDRYRRSLSELLQPRQQPAHCRPVLCRRYCEHGFQVNEDGCEICSCNPGPSVCKPVLCRRYCEYGFQVNEYGCQTCRCNPRPEECRPVLCRRYCEHGYEVNENGCEICSCRRAPREMPQTRRQERSILPFPSDYDDACFLAPVMGPCRARIQRWFFNPGTGNCETFFYGGCRGNENNFLSEFDCMQYCIVPERDIRLRLE